MENVSTDGYNLKLAVPCTVSIYSQSKGGKTSLCVKIIKNLQKVFSKPIHKVIYLYSLWQEAYESLKDEVTFVNQLEEVDQHIEPDKNHLLVLDDQILRASKKPSDIEAYFVQRSHHEKICCLYLSQTPYVKGGQLIALNSDYVILFNYPRNYQMIRRWFMQVDDSLANQLYNVYREIVGSALYSYMFISFHPAESNETRYRNSIFVDENTIIYRPKNGKNHRKL